ncbi:hypothetical protein V6617_18515 (plasmid) [Pelagibacterium nitratireducens]|uniref:Uncharacterized protein n=1 Tax=Pelagibacterium nitratireducens TaxID=1046114 RepID=A0ABZ2I6T2_9HYPH
MKGDAFAGTPAVFILHKRNATLVNVMFLVGSTPFHEDFWDRASAQLARPMEEATSFRRELPLGSARPTSAFSRPLKRQTCLIW